MASEELKRDQNHVTVLGGITDNVAQEVTMLRVDPTTKRLLVSAVGSAVGGDVNGPALATDNAVARFDGITGKLIQNSVVIIADTTGNMTGVGTINGFTISSTTGTLTITNAKTLSVTNTLTLSGTDSTVMTFPTTSATIARTDAGNTFTGVSTASAWVLTSPTITTGITPTSNDGAALGSTALNFSDLFLATGAVVNYANGNVVITHTSGILTMGTGEIRITTVGTNTASVVTVGGTQSLTNKTINGNTITTGTGTLTLGAGSTLATSATNSITLTSTGATNVTLPTTGTLATLAGTETLTNKRITPRINTVASSATPAINTDTTDQFTITALAANITSFTSSLSGTPTTGQKLIIRILDNGTARTIAWGASFASRGATLPVTTVISKYLYVGFLWNEVAATWDCVASVQES